MSRPASATTFGILNIVFGSLYVLSQGYAAVALPILFSVDIPEVRQTIQDSPDLQALQNESVFLGFFIVSIAVSFVGGALLLFAGIGLLKGKPSAPRISTLIAIAALILAVIQTVVNLTFVGPPETPGMDAETARAAQLGFGMCGLVIYAVYPVLLIIFMRRPAITQWCDPDRPQYAVDAPAGPVFEPWDR